MAFWNTEVEKLFFEEALKNFSTPEQLFYNLNSHYYAYIPYTEKNNGQTTENKEDKPNEEVLEMEEHKEHSKKRGNRRKFHTGRESPNT